MARDYRTDSDLTCSLATLHRKEEGIQPPFWNVLRLKVIPVPVDTNRLGTFSGEVKRLDTPLVCAQVKCEWGMKASGCKRGMASEGSFGPHPFIPFAPCDHEILVFKDEEIGFSLYETILSLKTNFRSIETSNIGELKSFCEKALFPSHALIVKPNQPKNEAMIIKGVQDKEKLLEAFSRCALHSKDGKVTLETDMRAHMNPTRMGVIKTLAYKLAKRLKTFCPKCKCPGWGMKDVVKGLECEVCGSETERVKYEVFGCPRCPYIVYQERKDRLKATGPENCPYCNP
jgi:hypothetical protein